MDPPPIVRACSVWGLQAFALLFGPTALGLKAWLRGNWAEAVQTSVPHPGTSFLGTCDSEK